MSPSELFDFLEREWDIGTWWHRPADEDAIAAASHAELLEQLRTIQEMKWVLWSAAGWHDFFAFDPEQPIERPNSYGPLLLQRDPDDVIEDAPTVVRIRQRLGMPRGIWPELVDEEEDARRRRHALVILEPLFARAVDLIGHYQAANNMYGATLGSLSHLLVMSRLRPDYLRQAQ